MWGNGISLSLFMFSITLNVLRTLVGYNGRPISLWFDMKTKFVHKCHRSLATHVAHFYSLY